MTWDEFAAKAITVPFKEKGRDWLAWDCWGLVVCAYRDVLEIEIPAYLDEYDTTADLKTLHKVFTRERNMKWIEVDREIGSVAMILRRNSAVHVGIAIGKRDVIHCEKTVNTVINRDRDLRISGFWKPAWAN